MQKKSGFQYKDKDNADGMGMEVTTAVQQWKLPLQRQSTKLQDSKLKAYMTGHYLVQLHVEAMVLVLYNVVEWLDGCQQQFDICADDIAYFNEQE